MRLQRRYPALRPRGARPSACFAAPSRRARGPPRRRSPDPDRRPVGTRDGGGAMTCRDLAARMLGAVTLATSWAICLWLRTVMLRPGNQPGLLEAALVLASFVLTLVGL